ncbi:hypothetical protein C8R47DRAFT_1324796 [Mycena vitilis]|nr:hypothetical protein C8R47DRAFT_1324796 [Mycena vitilis]
MSASRRSRLSFKSVASALTAGVARLVKKPAPTPSVRLPDPVLSDEEEEWDLPPPPQRKKVRFDAILDSSGGTMPAASSSKVPSKSSRLLRPSRCGSGHPASLSQRHSVHGWFFCPKSYALPSLLTHDTLVCTDYVLVLDLDDKDVMKNIFVHGFQPAVSRLIYEHDSGNLMLPPEGFLFLCDVNGDGDPQKDMMISCGYAISELGDDMQERAEELQPRIIGLESEASQSAPKLDDNRRRHRSGTGTPTYTNNGEVVPLPLDAESAGPSKARVREIRQFEKQRDKEADKRKKAADRRADAGVHVFPRLPGAPMPPVPERGLPSARVRRAPKNANDDLVMLEALKDKAKGRGKEKDTQKEAKTGAASKKRQAEKPPAGDAAKKKSTTLTHLPAVPALPQLFAASTRPRPLHALTPRPALTMGELLQNGIVFGLVLAPNGVSYAVCNAALYPDPIFAGLAHHERGPFCLYHVVYNLRETRVYTNAAGRDAGLRLLAESSSTSHHGLRAVSAELYRICESYHKHKNPAHEERKIIDSLYKLTTYDSVLQRQRRPQEPRSVVLSGEPIIFVQAIEQPATWQSAVASPARPKRAQRRPPVPKTPKPLFSWAPLGLTAPGSSSSVPPALSSTVPLPPTTPNVLQPPSNLPAPAPVPPREPHRAHFKPARFAPYPHSRRWSPLTKKEEKDVGGSKQEEDDGVQGRIKQEKEDLELEDELEEDELEEDDLEEDGRMKQEGDKVERRVKEEEEVDFERCVKQEEEVDFERCVKQEEEVDFERRVKQEEVERRVKQGEVEGCIKKEETDGGTGVCGLKEEEPDEWGMNEEEDGVYEWDEEWLEGGGEA